MSFCMWRTRSRYVGRAGFGSPARYGDGLGYPPPLASLAFHPLALASCLLAAPWAEREGEGGTEGEGERKGGRGGERLTISADYEGK